MGWIGTMAEILAFPKLEAGRRSHRQGVGAEVVIFPGVRVEYHDQPPKPAGRGRSRRPRRTRSGDAASA
jgi:hypothetical protein